MTRHENTTVTTVDPHEPVTPDECAESIRYRGACEHGPAYPTQERSPSVQALRETSTEGLLTAIEALTHRIHECRGNTRAGECDGPCADLRAKRRLVRAEILRRAGA